MSTYAFGKTVAMTHEQAIDAVTQALAREGFGVLTEIDAAATLKKKLGVDRPPYRILGLVGRPEIAPVAAEVRARLQRVLQAL
jgi:uncharacterized protein (DUF302 family)